MLHECDTNGDGKICWDEFYAMLLDTSTTALSSLACYDRRYVEEACVVSDKVDNETTTSRLDEV